LEEKKSPIVSQDKINLKKQNDINPFPTMASPLPVRAAALSRDTNETSIQIALSIDGGELPQDADPRLLEASGAHASQTSKSQVISINTGIGFLDHMLHALAKHAGWSMALNCKGDLHSASYHINQ
jgi:imidazoleglycerol-phosphate dehydratase